MADVLDCTGGRMKLWPGISIGICRLADEGLVVESTPPGAESGGGRVYRLTPLGGRAGAAEAERLHGFVQAARQKKLLKA